MDKKELMAEYNRAVLFGEIYDSKPATQKGQVAVRIGRGKNAGKFFIRGSKGGGAPKAKPKAKPKATQVGSKPISEAGKPAKVKAKQPWEMTLDEYHKTQNVTGEFSKRKATREHHQSVEAAKKEGKKVSQDNLVRYGIQDADNPQTRAMEKYFAKLKQEEKAKPKPAKKAAKGKTAKPKAAKKHVKMSESDNAVFKMQESILIRNKELKLSENQIKALTDDMKQDKSGV